MYLPQIDDERDTLVNYLDEQLTAIRASTLGLSEEQARETPLRSALSLAGLIKHCNYVMLGSLVGAGVRDDEVGEQPHTFALTDDESLEGELATFDELREQYLAMCREGDLETVMPMGPMPWFGMDETRDAKLRYLYVHHVEEFARHAGHADIIREQIDGATSPELVAAVEGWEPNEYVKPWQPKG